MLSIQDFGIGIPEDKISSLFINFGNLEEHQKTNPTGRGLGLSICKSIVEQMGGRVLVESELGKGSTFSVTFKVMYQINDSIDKSLSSEVERSANSAEKQVFTMIDTVQQKPKEDFKPSLFKPNQIKAEHQITELVSKPRLLLVNDDPFLLWSYE